MKAKILLDKLKDNFIFLDGATGTELQKAGMPEGVCPENWALKNPSVIQNIQRKYINAGSDIIYSCTFGLNKIKLKKYGLEDEVYRMNKELVKLSKEVADEYNNIFVAGDIAPTGEYMEPIGSYTFDEIVEVYKEQVKGLIDGGVDLFVIETMMNLQEARAAIIAIKESCDLPIMVSFTYEKNLRTLNGSSPITILTVLQDMGVDVVGCNCSSGPLEMVKLIKEMKPYAKVPLLAKPNAGLPKLKDGKTYFDMTASIFSDQCLNLVDEGASLIGGCCGTTYEHISQLVDKLSKTKPNVSYDLKREVISSEREFVDISKQKIITCEPLVFKEETELVNQIQMGNVFSAYDKVMEQVEQGVNFISFDFSYLSVELVEQIIKNVPMLTTMPLCIIVDNLNVIEIIARKYAGNILFKVKNEEQHKEIKNIINKYGGCIKFD